MRRLSLLALPVLVVGCQHPFGPDPAVPPVSPAQAQAAPAGGATAAAPSPSLTAPTFAPAGATAPAAQAAGSGAGAAPAQSQGGAQVPAERFDELVRNDFFDGLRGDPAALARVIKFCEDELAKRPGYP